MNQKPNANVAIWNKILQRDLNAFGNLVENYKNAVTAIAYSRIGDVASSEDIAQETFLVAWRSRDQLREPDRIGGWLCGIARNLSSQWLRNRKTGSLTNSAAEVAELADNQPSPLQQVISDEEHQLVWRSIAGLEEPYREVIVLFYRHSNSVQQIAEILEINEDAVRQRLSRARKLIREEVSRKVETILGNSNPDPQFTSTVLGLLMSQAITVSTASAKALTATSTVGTGLKAGTSISGSLLGKAGAAGAAGGLIGVVAGLGGAWFGTWFPAQTASTMSERRVIERAGKQTLIFAVILTMIALLLTDWGRQILPGKFWTLILFSIAISFVALIFRNAIRMNREIKLIRNTIKPEDDPNPTWLKDRMGIGSSNRFNNWVGRSGTSSVTFLGLPLWDFQVSDPNIASQRPFMLHAKGWIAVGDRATGFIAIGGKSRGVIAMGGLSVGLISFGGLSLGLISMGGMAAGFLSIGGLSIGHSAFGGAAVGWQSAGGCAVGIHSANGGLAIANSIADGGLAISRKFAVGGKAIAPEANTPAAIQAAEESWMAAHMSRQVVAADPEKFRMKNMIFVASCVAFSFVFSLFSPLLMYRRRMRDKG